MEIWTRSLHGELFGPSYRIRWYSICRRDGRCFLCNNRYGWVCSLPYQYYSDRLLLGELKWRYLTGSWIDTTAAIGPDGTVYVGSDDRHIYAINSWGRLKSDTIHIKLDVKYFLPTNDCHMCSMTIRCARCFAVEIIRCHYNLLNVLCSSIGILLDSFDVNL